MARLPLVREQDMTPEQRAQFERFPSNLTRGLLLAAPRLAKALPEVANALRDSGLHAKLREAAILRVAHLTGSAYERMQHYGQALKAGWRADEIAQIEGAGAVAFTGAPAALLRFVDECVRDLRVSDEAFDALRASLCARDIATVLFLVGHYMSVARFVANLDIELDDEPDEWLHEH
jgi:alkylhydroperoxidase family enzyme